MKIDDFNDRYLEDYNSDIQEPCYYEEMLGAVDEIAAMSKYEERMEKLYEKYKEFYEKVNEMVTKINQEFKKELSGDKKVNGK